MELLVTHLGADFDAFAAMLVARRLHPEARLFFPGSREGSLRRMLEARGVELDELRHRDVDPAAIERVVLCDTRQRERLGVVAQWLAARPQIEVLAYDHHPDSPSDVPIAGGHVDASVGATSTLIAELLRERGLAPTAEEATLLLMGIYEDSGSLTYATTSARDLAAAGWLLERGGDLDAVRRFAVHSLDRQHLDLLHRMTEELEVLRLHGHRVGVVVCELGSFVDELAPLVSRCLELFDLPLLFAIFGEGDRATVIARGQLEGFHLGQALAAVAGGGGHETAAAGSVKGATALEVRERLLAYLDGALPPVARARDLMIAPFVAVEAAATVAQAKERLVRARINAAPVVEEGAAVGAVTRQLLDAALQHELGERPVTAVMRQELEWVPPDAPAEELARRMVGQHPRFVLVGDAADRRPLGVVTRMSVLRHLHGRLEEAAEPLERRAREQRERRQGIGGMLAERVPAAVRERIETIEKVSRELGVPAYLVGGFVRDLLLGRENRDLDVVVEGDGPAFAQALGAALGAHVRVHEAFLTAVVREADGSTVDVASARSEFYRAPAVLPEVESSALRQDLYRRDFTINTMALRLGPAGPVELVDFFGGQRDLKEGVLRVLHSLSFIDDPTRVLRAVRLSLRLGFEVSPETLRLIGVAVGEGIFEQLSGGRLREELELLLSDPELALPGLERLDELGVLAVIHPALRLDAARRQALREARSAFDWYRVEALDEPAVRVPLLLLMALLRGSSAEARRAVGERLQLIAGEREVLERFPWRLERAVREIGGPGLLPHQAHAALTGLGGEELLLLLAGEDETVRTWVRRELTELRRLRLEVRGADLLERGHAPGPAIGEALRATLDARLDGEVTREGELEHVLEWLSRRAVGVRE
ncbi:MAG TPA: CBS domain-containing protein [Thermoanaerobaculia bacterium]|nr:CBS domain-containing protein [Thermoanaerobaculia bacterium]